MQGVDLLAQQVQPAAQPRVALRPLGVVLEVPMVTLGKERHAVYMGPLHCAGKRSRIERGPDIRDGWAGVKVEMDLTRRQGDCFGHWISP